MKITSNPWFMLYCIYNFYKAYICVAHRLQIQPVTSAIHFNSREHHGAPFLHSEGGLPPMIPASLLPFHIVGVRTAVLEKVPTHRRLLSCLFVP